MELVKATIRRPNYHRDFVTDILWVQCSRDISNVVADCIYANVLDKVKYDAWNQLGAIR